MPHWEWNAPRALAPWLVGFAASTDEATPERVRVMPDGGVDLLFAAPVRGGAWTAELFGAKTSALLVEDAERMDKIAVRRRVGSGCPRILSPTGRSRSTRSGAARPAS